MRMELRMMQETMEIKTSTTQKMPWASWDLPAWLCKTGAKLAKIKGSICNGCYALKGRYVFGSVKGANLGRFDQIKDPQNLHHWQVAFIGWFKSKLKRLKAEKRFFRWFTSGDLQSVDMLVAIVEIAKAIPEIQFWLPTKEHGFIREYKAVYGEFPANLNVRVSMFMVNQEPSKGLGLPTSTVINNPSDMNDKHENLCKASLEQFNGQSEVNCGDCRKCWDKNVQNVAYLYH